MSTPVSQSAASSVNGGGGSASASASARVEGGVGGASSPSSQGASASGHSRASRPAAAAAKEKFPDEQLRPHINKLLNSRLLAQKYQSRPRSLNKDIAEAVKAKMLDIAPKGFKYIVQVQLLENLGQGGSAFLACHWEESDSVIQEMFTSDDLICSVFCLAIRDS